jgi:5'-methylthioadenosine phosphorylase
VNYRANMHALESVGVTRVVSVASVGGIRADLGPGVLVVPHQIIDYTWGREMTFQSGGDGPVVHVDFTEPYDAGVRSMLLDVAQRSREPVTDGAVYATTQGPRLETAAEIDRLQRDGADIVGMTGMPEAGLARELDLPYAALCVVANWAAGRADSLHGIKFEELEAVLQEAMARVRRIIEGLCEA